MSCGAAYHTRAVRLRHATRSTSEPNTPLPQRRSTGMTRQAQPSDVYPVTNS